MKLTFVFAGQGFRSVGLIKRIGGDAQTIAMDDVNTLNDTVTTLKGEQ